MHTLAQFLHATLKHHEATRLLSLYPNCDAVKILESEYPNLEVWDRLAQALYSGQKPTLPKYDILARSGIYPAVEES